MTQVGFFQRPATSPGRPGAPDRCPAAADLEHVAALGRGERGGHVLLHQQYREAFLLAEGLPEFTETLLEFLHEGLRRHGRTAREKADPPHLLSLLRTGGTRRGEEGTREGADQRSPADHWITSSARRSSDGGTVKPRALAVLRLITSSNLVGCSTGRSAGLAPLRILSTNVAARRNRSG